MPTEEFNHQDYGSPELSDEQRQRLITQAYRSHRHFQMELLGADVTRDAICSALRENDRLKAELQTERERHAECVAKLAPALPRITDFPKDA